MNGDHKSRLSIESDVIKAMFYEPLKGEVDVIVVNLGKRVESWLHMCSILKMFGYQNANSWLFDDLCKERPLERISGENSR